MAVNLEWQAIRRLMLAAAVVVAIVGVSVTFVLLRGIRRDLTEQNDAAAIEAAEHRVTSRCAAYLVLRTIYDIAARAEIRVRRPFLPTIAGLDCEESLSVRLDSPPDVQPGREDPPRAQERVPPSETSPPVGGDEDPKPDEDTKPPPPAPPSEPPPPPPRPDGDVCVKVLENEHCEDLPV